MNHAAISYDDIVRLKHLRNVGSLSPEWLFFRIATKNLPVLNVSNWLP